MFPDRVGRMVLDGVVDADLYVSPVVSTCTISQHFRALLVLRVQALNMEHTFKASPQQMLMLGAYSGR